MVAVSYAWNSEENAYGESDYFLSAGDYAVDEWLGFVGDDGYGGRCDAYFVGDKKYFLATDDGQSHGTVTAPAKSTAYASTQSALLDGKSVEFQCYALKDENGYDTNYIKLRDVASVLNGTAAQFNVGWDKAVNIETGKAYAANGSEMFTPYSGNRSYEKATAATNINSKKADLDAILLKDDNGAGYTYYKLRDLGDTLGFKVDWSAAKGISIETK